jgi:L-amino acid N-acyltransferase YncA
VTIVIRPMATRDAERVLAVYQAGLDIGDASFETTAPSWDAFNSAHLLAHRLVAADASTELVLGWVAATEVFSRCVHAGVIEHSIYVDPVSHRRGIGTELLGALIRSADAAGVWTIEAGIFPENAASLRLHERAGFRTVGTREQIGRLQGKWRDVVFLERRSTTARAC